jgi:aminopeptidase N
VASGFHRADQQELMAAYVKPYFDSILPSWEAKVIEEALELIQSMYPRMVVSQKVLDVTDEWLAGSEQVPGPVRRSLLESQDDLRRALKARSFNR